MLVQIGNCRPELLLEKVLINEEELATSLLTEKTSKFKQKQLCFRHMVNEC